MSVGHYIAYTCSLDWATEYKNCPKDKLKKQKQQQEQLQQQNQLHAPQTHDKNLGKLKKIFSRSKTSSSSEMSKAASASSNGPTSALNGGMEKLQNTICPGGKCCGIELKNNLPSATSTSSSQSNGGIHHNGYYEDNDDYGTNNPNWAYANGGGNVPSSTGSTPTGSGSKEPIWYMCDDDKIKTMTQREFEDLLSPNRKITVTPYLLFYARSDLQ